MRKTYENEGHVKKDVKEILKKLGILYFMPVGGYFGASGIADFVCCGNGIYIEIETKFGSNKLSELQKAHRVDVEYHHGYYLEVNEKNIGLLEHALSRILNRIAVGPMTLV